MRVRKQYEIEMAISICLSSRGRDVMDNIATAVLGNNLLPVYYFYVARTSVVYGSFVRTKRGMDRLELLPDLTISVRG
jgi:hypothetical protein